jgi:hypothetical protein
VSSRERSLLDATVRLEHPVGRFANGRVRCPPLTLEKLSS